MSYGDSLQRFLRAACTARPDQAPALPRQRMPRMH